MKTLKALKTASLLNGIYCLCCVVSIVFVALHHYLDIDIFFTLGFLLSYGWIVNPVGIITFYICLSHYREERKSPEQRQLIQRKWIWIFLWPMITTVFFVFGGGLFVVFTGGV